MMKRYLLCFLIFAVFSCSNGKEANIKLFDELHFSLKDGEAAGVIDAKVLRKYNTYFNNLDSVQIPLFKYVNSHTYEIFIGLPIDSEINELLRHKILYLNSLNTKFDFKSDSSFYFLNYHDEQNKIYLEEYLNKPTETSLIYIAAIINMTENKEIIFCNLELSNRLISKLN